MAYVGYVVSEATIFATGILVDCYVNPLREWGYSSCPVCLCVCVSVFSVLPLALLVVREVSAATAWEMQ